MIAPEDIRDIRGPVFIVDHWPLILEIAGALLVATLAALALRAWSRARARRSETPIERARAALRIAEEHARAGRAHEWAEIVAETLRTALAGRLGTSVLPETTRELAPRLWQGWSYEGPLLPSQLDVPRTLAVLEACDLARFARAAIEAPALLETTATARAIVEQLHAPATSARAPAPDHTPNVVTS